MTLDSFNRDFKIQDHQRTVVGSLIVGLQQVGAIVSSIASAPLSERIGRRKAIIVSCIVFNIGVLLEVLPVHSLPLFYVGRIIAGLGLGSCFSVAPMYLAEMAPKEIRGRLGSCLQWMFTWGMLVSYLVDLAVAKLMGPIAMQWQIPLGLQMVPAGLLGLGLWTQKESVRWLLKKGRRDEAWQSLKWIRADAASAKLEFDEMQLKIQKEMEASQAFRKRELLEPANRHRLLLAFLTCLCQQSTGAPALAYFGPQFFTILLGHGQQALTITAFFGVIKIVACGAFVIFLSERLGRRQVFILGGLSMAVCMILTGVLLKTFPPSAEGGASSASIATVVLIFINIAFYNCSWGPFAYLYIAEIFPVRLREIGVAVGIASMWTFTCAYSFATPYMIEYMGWGTFIYYGVTDVCMALFAFFVMKETHGVSLEEMDELFQHRIAGNSADYMGGIGNGEAADAKQGVEETKIGQ